jgi:PAS domain-containing protein
MDSSNTTPACPSDDEKPLQLQLCVKPLIALATTLALGVSVLCLNFGYSIVFPHLYYIPIIIMCACFPRIGIWFTVAVAAAYVALVFGVTRDLELLIQALFRAVFFLIIGGVMIYLTRKRAAAEEALSFERKNLASIVDEQTDCIARELEQSKRLENAYRAATEYYDRLMNQANAAIVIWNSGFYITRTNAVFERIAGKPKTELLGRKVSAIMPLDEAAIRSPNKPVILPVHKASGSPLQVLWTFTEIYAPEQTEPFAYLAIGQELS